MVSLIWPMKLYPWSTSSKWYLSVRIRIKSVSSESLTEYLPKLPSPITEKLEILLISLHEFEWSSVGESCWEDVAAGWPMNWTQASRDSSPSPSLKCFFFHHLRFHRCNLERARSCWDHLDWIYYWTQLRPLYKCLRLWWTGADVAVQDKLHK